MAIDAMTDEQMRGALKELGQALYNHEQWAEMLYGTLICRLPPDQRDLDPNAHQLCRFGQWYYSGGVSSLGDHLGMAEVGREHEHMHRYAARLLKSSVADGVITLGDYDRFVSSLKRLRLEIATVQHELENVLYSLDPLTGAPGRIHMLTTLRKQHELMSCSKHPCSIAMLDLDHFKSVNDTFGHPVGDRVLVSVAHFIMSRLRPYDKVFRYGGEEFLLCLPDTELEAARAIADRLRAAISALPHDVDGNKSIHVSASAGLAALVPELSVEQSIECADKALYLAKAEGRNRTKVWTPSMAALSAPNLA